MLVANHSFKVTFINILIDFKLSVNLTLCLSKAYCSSWLLDSQEAPGAGMLFQNVLWAMVVLVGCSMTLGGCMVAYRHFKTGGRGAPMYLPVQAAVSILYLAL